MARKKKNKAKQHYRQVVKKKKWQGQKRVKERETMTQGNMADKWQGRIKVRVKAKKEVRIQENVSVKQVS